MIYLSLFQCSERILTLFACGLHEFLDL
jgi:hypothetical protein